MVRMKPLFIDCFSEMLYSVEWFFLGLSCMKKHLFFFSVLLFLAPLGTNVSWAATKSASKKAQIQNQVSASSAVPSKKDIEETIPEAPEMRYLGIKEYVRAKEQVGTELIYLASSDLGDLYGGQVWRQETAKNAQGKMEYYYYAGFQFNFSEDDTEMLTIEAIHQDYCRDGRGVKKTMMVINNEGKGITEVGDGAFVLGGDDVGDAKAAHICEYAQVRFGVGK